MGETEITHERNGYWTAICYVKGHAAVGTNLHTEDEAREWLRNHAELWSRIEAIKRGEEQQP